MILIKFETEQLKNGLVDKLKNEFISLWVLNNLKK